MKRLHLHLMNHGNCYIIYIYTSDPVLLDTSAEFSMKRVHVHLMIYTSDPVLLTLFYLTLLLSFQ